MDLIIDLNNLNNNTLKTAIVLHEMKKGHRIVGNPGFSLFEITIVNEEKINNIGTWNVSNVTNMEELFRITPEFDSDITGWDTKKVTNMSFMFSNCTNFNKPVILKTPRVSDVSYMFSGCFRFNSPVELNTTSVTNMEGMFWGCNRFNHPVKFITKNVTNMKEMFCQCENFNHHVSFQTSLVETMEAMFRWCSSLNEPVIFKNVSSLTNMEAMFQNCTNFNQPVSFDTVSVTNMSFMFSECIRFNNMIDLDTRSVIDMSYMFDNCSSFNEKLDFDTSNVQNMKYMFNSCSVFDQNISDWDVSNVVDHTGIFRHCGIEIMFKPLFKKENETRDEYENRQREHLIFVNDERKRNFFGSRSSVLTLKSALKKHYRDQSLGEDRTQRILTYRSRGITPKQPTNAEKVLFGNVRNITSFIGEPKFLTVDKRHVFSKTRKRRNSIGG